MSNVDWVSANQNYLTASLAVVRAAVQRCAGLTVETPALPVWDASLPPPALDVLSASFGLSPFERSVLLLCAGVELDSAFPPLCASAQGDPARAYATFSLALAAFADTAHWNALAPSAPLRRWRMLELSGGSSLTVSPLRVDERALHYLAGVTQLDERLLGVVEPVHGHAGLAGSHAALAEAIGRSWSRGENASLPVVQLCGDESASKRAIAAHACAHMGLNLHRLPASHIPIDAREQEALMRLWERETVLSNSALLLDCDDIDAGDAARAHAVQQVLEHTLGALIVSTRERRHVQRPALTLDVHKPDALEQQRVWQQSLGEHAARLNGEVERLVSQFHLSATYIQNACAQLALRADEELFGALWDACRVQARPRLDDLAQRIEPIATWDDLVLAESQLNTLHDIAAHVRQRYRVYETWGFAAKSSRGLGISALFAGASGTGKTMAAEVLANELRLDLYRIDLSSVVNKYIGETEKNLRKVFDAAEEGGAILLFDEADALFGKRSEIKDSHDRYANIEVSYLLQRMEAYRGLAILTTNMKEALDTAFMRRIRFIVHFAFPDLVQRAEIWKRIFPASTPTYNLDVHRLARLNVAGGNIRNIALNAAFRAADQNETVGMGHLLHAARSEYAKLEKPLTDSEVRDWVR